MSKDNEQPVGCSLIESMKDSKSCTDKWPNWQRQAMGLPSLQPVELPKTFTFWLAQHDHAFNIALKEFDRAIHAKPLDGSKVTKDQAFMSAMQTFSRWFYENQPKREMGEVTEAMCDRARWFILARDAGIFTWGELVNSIPKRPTIGLIEDMISYHPKDHITKSEFAECVYELMITHIEGGKP